MNVFEEHAPHQCTCDGCEEKTSQEAYVVIRRGKLATPPELEDTILQLCPKCIRLFENNGNSTRTAKGTSIFEKWDT